MSKVDLKLRLEIGSLFLALFLEFHPKKMILINQSLITSYFAKLKIAIHNLSDMLSLKLKLKHWVSRFLTPYLSFLYNLDLYFKICTYSLMSLCVNIANHCMALRLLQRSCLSQGWCLVEVGLYFLET